MIDGNHLYQFFYGKVEVKEEILELKDKIQNYGQLIIKLVFFTNRLATQFITVPDIGQTVYLNNIGMRALNDEFKTDT